MRSVLAQILDIFTKFFSHSQYIHLLLIGQYGRVNSYDHPIQGC
jgi:hypothetical protein